MIEFAEAGIGWALATLAAATYYGNKRQKPVAGQKTAAGRSWDNLIGRDGLIGGIGDLTGLWDSGSETKRKINLGKDLDLDISNAENNNELVKGNMWQNHNYSTGKKQRETGGLLSGIQGSGNLSTDTSRYSQSSKAISETILNMNKDFNNTLIKGMDRDKATADSVSALELQKNSINS